MKTLQPFPDEPGGSSPEMYAWTDDVIEQLEQRSNQRLVRTLMTETLDRAVVDTALLSTIKFFLKERP